MEVSAAGETFSDDQIKEMMPNYLYKFLFHITAHGKLFDNTSFSEGIFNKSYVPRLRRCLKEGFRLNEDPLPYNKKAQGYELKFKCESEFPEESFMPEDATPSGVPRKVKSKKRSIDEQL